MNKEYAKNLEKIFYPSSIAIVGASCKPNSVGQGLLRNALEGQGLRKIFAINPFQQDVCGTPTYPTLLDVKEDIDLVIIAVPAKTVPEVIDQCCAKKVGGVIIISAGFAETGTEGKKVQADIVKKLQKANIPMIGPNCLGIINPHSNLNASFAPATPKKGEIAFISQSGAMIDSIIDIGLTENFGFSKIISLGNMADLDLIEFLEILEKDNETKVITIYIEGISEGRRALEAAKRITKKKPIIVIKAGKSEGTKKAVSTHTGSLAGDYQIYQAAFKQAGVIEADSVMEMFDIAKALSWQPQIKDGVAIITNGGGCGILAVDYCDQEDIKLVDLDPATIKKIDKSGVMNPAWSHRNPADILGDAGPERYQIVLNSLLEQKNIKGLLVIQTLQIMTNPIENAKFIIEAKNKFKDKAIVCSFVGGKLTKASMDLLEENKIPNYIDPHRAVKAMKFLIK